MEIEFANEKVNLLPCPFCGSDPAVHSYKRSGLWYRIYCTGDDCPMRPVTCNFRSLGQAATAWNHRPKED